LFTNCGDSDDPVADTPTNTTDDGSTTVLDADGDGVADADDTCTDTPEGATVDINGCSDSQKDTDFDGVTDDFDTCEETPEGAAVDENGCADSQKDTDGDGVTDDLDKCDETAEDASVDENGCSDSQTFIGDPYQGGIVYYLFQEGDAGYVVGEVHGLIAAIEDQTTAVGAEWVCYEFTGAEGTAIGTRAQNTLDILAGCSEDGIPAKPASDYEVTVDGVTYDDWFLPSKDELNKLYLQRDVVGGFAINSYWSSTVHDNFSAWVQNFFNGFQNYFSISNTYRVRAVRSF